MANQVIKDLPNGQQITLSGSLKVREVKVLSQSAEDPYVIIPICMRLITGWTLTDDGAELDPKNLADWDELTVEQYKAVVEAVGEYIQGPAEKN